MLKWYVDRMKKNMVAFRKKNRHPEDGAMACDELIALIN